MHLPFLAIEIADSFRMAAMAVTDTGTKMLKCCYNKTLKYVTLASGPTLSSEEMVSAGSKNGSPSSVAAKCKLE